MTVQCLTCDRFTLRGSSLAKHGAGHCALRPKHEHFGATRKHDCENHLQTTEAKMVPRRVWLAKMNSGDNGGP